MRERLTNHPPDGATLKLMTFLSPLPSSVVGYLGALLSTWTVTSLFRHQNTLFCTLYIYISVKLLSGNTKQSPIVIYFNYFRHIGPPSSAKLFTRRPIISLCYFIGDARCVLNCQMRCYLWFWRETWLILWT